jgi:putative transposase
MEIEAPRVNDRRIEADGNRQRFTRAFLPAIHEMRRSPKVAEVLPILYLRGLSTGDSHEALKALLGETPPGWRQRTSAGWSRSRSMCTSAYGPGSEWIATTSYIWAVHFTNIRLEEDRLCTLVLMGARPDGTKPLIAVEEASARPIVGARATQPDTAWHAGSGTAVGVGALEFLDGRS